MKRCLDFSLKCVKNTRNKRLFPINPNHDATVRYSEPYTVNFSRTDTYKRFRYTILPKTAEQAPWKKLISVETSTRKVKMQNYIIMNDNLITRCITIIFRQ